MSTDMNLARFVDSVLFIKNFNVVRLVVCVAVISVYSSLLPPAVTRTQWTSFLCGRSSSTSLAYVTFLWAGTICLLTKRIVLFPSVIRVPTPYASLPRSFANVVSHNYFSGLCIKCLYSCESHVASSITALHKFTSLNAFRTVYTSEFACNCKRRGYLCMIGSFSSSTIKWGGLLGFLCYRGCQFGTRKRDGVWLGGGKRMIVGDGTGVYCSCISTLGDVGSGVCTRGDVKSGAGG